jgi:hypothetical protein
MGIAIRLVQVSRLRITWLRFGWESGYESSLSKGLAILDQ